MATDKTFYIEVGRRIRQARKGIGLTQEALASLASLSRTSITNIEKGRQKLLLHTLADLASALHVDPAELIPSRNAARTRNLDELLKGSRPETREWVLRTVKSVLKEKSAPNSHRRQVLNVAERSRHKKNDNDWIFLGRGLKNALRF